MKKLLSFVLSFSLILGVCFNACYAVDSNEVAPENAISEEMRQYYYEDALSRISISNSTPSLYAADSSNSDEKITYANGGLECIENDLLRQTVIEIRAVNPGSERIRYVTAHHLWYNGEMYLATVSVLASFYIVQDVSVAEYHTPEFSSEINPNMTPGLLFIDEGEYSVTVKADKSKCTLVYNYRLDFDWFLKSSKFEITCDNQANVTGEGSTNKYW